MTTFDSVTIGQHNSDAGPAFGDKFELIHPLSDVHDPPTTFGYWLRPGHTLHSMPPSTMTERLRTAMPGAVITPVTHGPQIVVVPVLVRTPTAEELPEAIAWLFSRFDPIANYGRLSRIWATRSDGSVGRYIDGHLDSAASRVTSQQQNDTTREVAVNLVFRCPYPYWRESASASLDLEVSAPALAGDSDTGVFPTGGDMPAIASFTIRLFDPVEITNIETNKTFTVYPPTGTYTGPPGPIGPYDDPENYVRIPRTTIGNVERAAPTRLFMTEPRWDLVSGEIPLIRPGDSIRMELTEDSASEDTLVAVSTFKTWLTA